jgi:uncharacterized SAM-dependent methyltransferase
LARKTVQVSYQQASVTPSKRKRVGYEIPTKNPKGLSPLAQYVEDNRDTGISVQELIAQYQEYDCEHKEMEIYSTTSEKVSSRCLECGLVQTKFKPGVKP